MCEEELEPFYKNIEELTLQNSSYRKVLYTGKQQQFVIMSIPPSDDIHMETHPETDQFIRIEKGKGVAIINKKNYDLHDGIGLIIPAGAEHQIKNTSDTEDLKLYTIYSPPEHSDGKEDKENPDKSKYLKYKMKYLELKQKGGYFTPP